MGVLKTGLKQLPLMLLLGWAALSPTLSKAEPMEKPMAPASLQLAKEQADAVVVARFQGYQTDDSVGYFEGVTALYRVEQVLKSKVGSVKPGKTVAILYEFHDGSACLAPSGWKFSPSLMPKQGTSWVLILKTPESGQFTRFHTIRGDWGRKPATPAEIAQVKALFQ